MAIDPQDDKRGNAGLKKMPLKTGFVLKELDAKENLERIGRG